MAKTWVLDTETKGTGAEMVPYEKTLRRDRREPELALVEFDRPPREEPAAEPRAPQRFKVVDVMSARTLAEDVGVREAVRALEPMRSVLDARISVWSTERGRWRLLPLEEAKQLWEFRGRLGAES
jgi:hypothetical protein